MQPWALKQAIVFTGFLGIAVGMSWMRESTIKAIAFPLYAVTLVMLIGVEALGFVSKGAQRWLDLGPIRLFLLVGCPRWFGSRAGRLPRSGRCPLLGVAAQRSRLRLAQPSD